MEIKTHKVKEYNSTKKTVVVINGEPVCIVKGKKTLSNIIAYAQGYYVDIKDGKVKKAIDKIIEGEHKAKMKTKFKMGQKVKVNEESVVYCGITGIIVDILIFPWGVKYAVDDGSGDTRYFPEDKLEKLE